jgi:PucR C-terminal helix-turn-helix domain/GGDEF-like domain
VARQDHGVLLVRAPGDDDRSARQVAEEALNMLGSRARTRVVAGVGDPQRHLTDTVSSYRQALLAARVAAAVPSVGDVASWSRLGAYRALVQLPPGERCDSCLDPRLVRLLDADPDLARTVETYLDLGGDAGRTAEQLNVHRATLYYRLNKAQQLTDANLRDGNDRLALHLGFKLARLIERYLPSDGPASSLSVTGTAICRVCRSPTALGARPVCRATISCATGPQIRPWQYPMPHLVRALTARKSPAPAATAAVTAAAVTSSHRQITVSSSGSTASSIGKSISNFTTRSIARQAFFVAAAVRAMTCAWLARPRYRAAL